MSLELGFAAPAYEAAEEGFAAARVVVIRSTAQGPLRVSYAVGGTAIPGRDFGPLSGVIEFADGESEASLLVEPRPNYRNTRCDETVVLSLPPGSTKTRHRFSTTTVTIRHDPAPKGLPSDPHFFAAMDLRRPELGTVRAAVNDGDFAQARAALAAYFRARVLPIWPRQPLSPDYALIDAARRRTFTISGITHTFSDRIDWSCTAIPNPNFGWEFNRHPWWIHYAEAYIADRERNANYARTLFAELRDWIDTSPVSLIYYSLHPGDRWRHLEVGLRVGTFWPQTFALVKDSPLLSDDLLVDWLKSFYVHARHLEVNAELFTNRGVTEAFGLYAVGLFFPEFADSTDWVRLGLERLEAMLRHDVTPDGVENEFSPGYHHIIIADIVKMRKLAAANGRSLPAFIEATLLKLFDYLLFASAPDRTLPLLNDSYRFSICPPMAVAADLYPDRPDFRWIATGGREGQPPERRSQLFPDAGHAVLRSSWEPDACYLLFDAGPFGTSHGHEDGLSLNLYGYGMQHLIDCGPYDYEDRHPYRRYSVGSHGKTIPLIDDLDQNRRSALQVTPGLHPNVDVRVGEPEIPPPHVWIHATKPRWLISEAFEYVAGTYGLHADEVWGPARERSAIVTRHIVYLPPDLWIVVDQFKALDQRSHTYSSLFQCNAVEAPIDPATQRVTLQLQPGDFDPARRTVVDSPQPSLTITPLLQPGQTVSVCKGQDAPVVSGYRFEKSTPWKKHPIPTVRYDLPGVKGDAHLAYVLAAAPAAAEPRRPTVTAVSTSPGALGLRLSFPDATLDRVMVLSLDGSPIAWSGANHNTPVLVVPAA